MKKKITLKLIALLSIIIILIYIGNSLYDLRKEQIIKDDINLITNEFNHSLEENEKIDELLNTIKTSKGDYRIVEENIKSYYKDVYSSIKNINFLLNSDFNYLSSENIEADKPDFSKSKENIENTKNQIEELYQYLAEFTKEEIYTSYMDENLDNYYKNFYKTLIKRIENPNWLKDIKTAYLNKIEKLNVYNEALDFLIKHEKSWEINDNLIDFEDEKLYEEYSKITEKLNS